jgi:hypothetical protein
VRRSTTIAQTRRLSGGREGRVFIETFVLHRLVQGIAPGGAGSVSGTEHRDAGLRGHGPRQRVARRRIGLDRSDLQSQFRLLLGPLHVNQVRQMEAGRPVQLVLAEVGARNQAAVGRLEAVLEDAAEAEVNAHDAPHAIARR